ncbi:UDP-N-acetylmuramate dehydrogenase [Parapedobacter indicus]|uniref:UDP-N-acetylenolpyruvoylglucosamine reductase n=1 Tax=Parapedobacter indicus TaxID=1477437 RepID=A0A1I3F1A7_9SPHI|nr:UDP-N-acetylmuramate dehydrogenase [Parapedobacter indicus]PPL03514.1 UDP-N-acetylmuramate dehydrogenase [Parapedobacter indicus]SFI04982.1 UDP-N-acetylmuramate dehydrogenase [Parapedobacter indicus]
MEFSVKKHFSLKPYNTFGIAAFAAQFIEIDSEEALVHLFYNRKNQTKQPFLILGGGSNILFTKDFTGLVIHIGIPGISHRISDTKILVTAGAGVIWNDLVWYCVDRNFAGIENMALIPGTVGAAPVQNIGAYGTELKDVFISCRVFDTKSGEISTFYKDDCQFSYRDSLFKKQAKGRYIITQVTLELSLTPSINTSYGAIHSELAKRNITHPTIKDIAEVVSAIRTDKLPDPSTIGNSGSFFKNPIITVQHLKQLQFTFQDMNFVYYPVDESHVKLAAGWLIEQCGWKGKRIGDAGTWKNQALVLVNHKNASGSDIYNLSERIIRDVEEKFNITLEREVNII